MSSNKNIKNKSQDENKEFNLFVGGLNQSTTEEAIKEYFEKFGKIEKVNLIIDWVTNKSKRCAIVICEDRRTMMAIIKRKKHKIENKAVRVNKADRKKKGTKIIKTKKIFVGNLNEKVLKNDVERHFKKFGKILNLTLVKNSLEINHQVGTHVLIEYSNEREAKYALDSRDTHEIGGVKLTVSPFKANKQSEISKIYELLSDIDSDVVNCYILNYFGGVFNSQSKAILKEPGNLEIFVTFVKALELEKQKSQEYPQGYNEGETQVSHGACSYSQNGRYRPTGNGYNQEDQGYGYYSSSYQEQQPNGHYSRYQGYNEQRPQDAYQQGQYYESSYQGYQGYQENQSYQSYQGYCENSQNYYGAGYEEAGGSNEFIHGTHHQHISQEAKSFGRAWNAYKRNESPEILKGQKGYLEILPKVQVDYGNYGKVAVDQVKFEDRRIEKTQEEIEEENLLKEVFSAK